MIRTVRAAVFSFLAVATAAWAQHGDVTQSEAARPPLYGDLGTWKHAVTTASPQAQRYFDQGLRLAYAFNHEEAARSFREAARLDPRCPMAWWGIALVAGPNINLPMDEEHRLIANEAIARAAEIQARASAVERSYITALSRRYSTDAKTSRAGLDSAYANAMREHAKRFPNDADASVLYAESLLDLNPWNQWTLDGTPTSGTLEIVAILEAALKRWPNHPGALHLYIHTVEASPDPARALPMSALLENLMPGAGHLVHMPAHIYARTGRYHDALELNERAAAIDEKFIAEQKPRGVYPHMYYNHNLHFVWFTASMQGRSAEALAAARKLAGRATPEILEQMTTLQHALVLPANTLAHFGRWEDVLREPIPAAKWRYSTAMSNYARGRALVAQGDLVGAYQALDSIRVVGKSISPNFYVSINLGLPLVQIAEHMLAAALAAQQKKMDVAVEALRKAVAIEDGLHYDEPPTWYFPARHDLGAVLLDAGRAAEAEAVYREDLRRHPENGWGLFGLAKALRAQDRGDEAAAIEARQNKAWARADVTLRGTAF